MRIVILLSLSLLSGLTPSYFPFIQEIKNPLVITHLAGDFYIYTTYNMYKGTPYPANGMYVVTNEGVLLIDTPWDSTQYQPLLDSIKQKHNKEVTLCIATHFHDDRTGGLEYYSQLGIPTYTTSRTDELSKEHGSKRAELLIENDTTFILGQYTFQTYHPGHGHTADNIIIWFENEQILYGGCLIKSYVDKNLGNLADADSSAYAQTIMNVQSRCPSPAFVIPGHNDWSTPASLPHTLRMARELSEEKQE
jgi:metallo-beta-lactamase class B